MDRTGKEIIWHKNTLPSVTLRALEYFATAGWLSGSGWYLAGGTALALHVGHRTSEDLDFFTREKDFASADVLKHLSEPEWKTDIARDGTIWGSYRGGKVSFISYPFFIPQESLLSYGNIHMLSPRDIAVMKIVALSQRGRKRDFVDLYWYAMHREPLTDVIKRLPKQYPTVAHDYHHILKAMLYFADAEEDPMPSLNFLTDWEKIKKYFRDEVPKITKQLWGV